MMHIFILLIITIVILCATIIVARYMQGLKRKRLENSIRRRKQSYVSYTDDRSFRIYDVIDGTQKREKKKEPQKNFPREFRYLGVKANSVDIQFLSIDEIKRLIDKQQFERINNPVIKDDLFVSNLFIYCNGYFLPRNFVVGGFVTKNYDHINLITFYGDVFRIAVNKFSELAIKNTKRQLLLLFPNVVPLVYTGFLAKTMLTNAIENYNAGNVDYVDVIEGNEKLNYVEYGNL